MLFTHLIFSFIWLQSPVIVPMDAPLVLNPALPVLRDNRIFGIIPGYGFVEKPDVKLPKLTPGQKLELFAKESLDPFTFFGAAVGATVSHAEQSNPAYGEGSRAYRQRLGAAYIDVASQNFFSDALLATIFREDPRYYRLGPKASILKRVGYSMSRVVVTRTDSGKTCFNFSGVLGTAMGIGLSNAYYPQANHNGGEMLSRAETSFASSAVSNLLPEFWPDIKQLLAKHKKPKN